MLRFCGRLETQREATARIAEQTDQGKEIKKAFLRGEARMIAELFVL